ncbi:MAG: hypothetical protein WCO55_01245 [Candidatus Falkowbacteria bacterium]
MMSLRLKYEAFSKLSEEQLYGLLVGAMGILFILAAIKVNSQEDYSEFWLIVGWGSFFCLMGVMSYFWENLKIPTKPEAASDKSIDNAPAEPSWITRMMAVYYKALHNYEEAHPVVEKKPLSKKAKKKLKQAKPKQIINRPAASNSQPLSAKQRRKQNHKANH